MLGFYFIVALAACYPLRISGMMPVECVSRQGKECDQSLLPRELPTTADQLRDACRDVQELANCTLNVYEDCMEDDEELGGFREIADYINDICREDSEIFQVISTNIECIASNTENIFESCRTLSFSEPTKELILTLREHADETEVEMGVPEHICIWLLWQAYCPSTKLGITCGFQVGEAVKYMLLHRVDEDFCPAEFLAEVTPVLELLETEIVHEEILKKIEGAKVEAPEELTRRRRRFASNIQTFRDKFY